MKQSTYHLPEPAARVTVNAASIARVVLLCVAWAGLVPFLIMIMCTVLATWRCATFLEMLVGCD